MSSLRSAARTRPASFRSMRATQLMSPGRFRCDLSKTEITHAMEAPLAANAESHAQILKSPLATLASVASVRSSFKAFVSEAG